ncbi:4-diphosphocytidyl-2C-methyl-D-erythritol kinase [Ureibacillus sp. FSL K6-8385]|uniref:4-diphosphocytidyl-2C-methyl-D-erythritol kinase n=1 Tax=Ureibacillus terrenus TaxID=118246 RepID=A0A540V3M1_9BACL|nr:4-diphosphocytidyl-2C-methyl-D-erythritol kinase [Ureibacillus terrenus]MED3661838.1 4-diphosphocytidyl-2C-methyl-D-erythritol kinase [Ureibacillus terrenus]MED3763141.1 4-diphosphocytidyl-2C-methyl-D-erythritol kinase [Ureibacillus terrenus]TQE91352.1 4-diphosphocytidyl-2C-methyl-D-erythritol kinase [Ureibacillus terrenus]
MEEPLLFIQTPPFYYIDVEEDAEEACLEESTSVYEISRRERIKNPVIARQLHYFSQPGNRKHRHLTFHLTNGEKITGLIEGLDGINIKIRTKNAITTIHANDIASISLASKGLK